MRTRARASGPSERGGSSAPTRGEGERGSVTAELALALPAVALIVALGVTGLLAASTHVRLQDGAADAARLVARGEEGRAPAAVTAAVPGAASSVARRGELVCVTASVGARVAMIEIPLQATSCALAGGL
ncbi:TadE family type IV pilus minor pilin [Microbacterium sp. Marseille-Q6965]|uniref:TadE family type IV pilus minor pilin n=1 Tax=Microbacterium sp. Marseille-Q6965 TaxID=2965072 RepID=UPI0021B71529|nr:TadE family type IV pilus minor pilin [Microbacterium sp. Marseille-Q6965]